MSQTYTLNKKQVNKLRKQFPALFEHVVGGKRVPIEVEDVHLVLPDSPSDPVEVHCAPGIWLGDIPFSAAWRL
jgi:hypothetical protein